MNNFENLNILITGASGGIGTSLSMAFALTNAKLFLIGSSQDKISKLQKKLPCRDNINYFSIDLSERKNVNNFCDSIIDQYGGINVIINNAGITGPTAPLWEYDVDDWNKIVQINLMGTFNCCRAIAPNMIKNNYGRIVNVASVAGKDGNANASAYSSGKAGAIGLTKSLGKELADYNIAVNAVTPAGAKTRILDQMSKEHVQRMLSKVPRGRFLEIHEFTSLVCWLCSEENSFSTAAVFDISGGRSTY